MALFPSIKSRSTGLIVRKRVEKTSLKFPGFNHKHGARYIVMNKNYTGDLHGLANILPRRKKKQGVTPGMTGKTVNNRNEEDNGEHQWFYPSTEPTAQGQHRGEEEAPEGGGAAGREAEEGDAREGERGGAGHQVTGGVLGRAAGTNLPSKMPTSTK